MKLKTHALDFSSIKWLLKDTDMEITILSLKCYLGPDFDSTSDIEIFRVLSRQDSKQEKRPEETFHLLLAW